MWYLKFTFNDERLMIKSIERGKIEGILFYKTCVCKILIWNAVCGLDIRIKKYIEENSKKLDIPKNNAKHPKPLSIIRRIYIFRCYDYCKFY